MALDVDTLLDRRRQARRIAFWRGMVFTLVVSAIVAAVSLYADPRGQHIARLSVTGVIASDRPLLQLIDRLKRDDRVAGVLVAIDSPGGTSVGGERLFDALRDLAGAKPVVSHINTLGASAAYMTALGTDHIVAQRTSLTGSIGVLIQYGQIDGLLTSLGIEVAKVESGPLKAEPNPFEPTKPEAVAALQSVVDDSFAYFLELVENRRGLSVADARRVADGRIYTGAQALAEKLIDALGNEATAIDWMETTRGVAADLPVRNYEPRDEEDEFSLTARMASAVASHFMAALGLDFRSFQAGSAVDGLWSVWHAR